MSERFRQGETPERYSSTPEEMVLESAPIERKVRLGGGCNIVKFFHLHQDGDAVFKPKEGEARGLRNEIERGTYYKRERAAYLVDRFLGFGLVPPTIVREINGELGSAQQFIQDAKTLSGVDYETREKMIYDFIRLYIFDLIIWNTDRHSANALIANGKLYAIDNGLAFGRREEPRCYDDYVGYEGGEPVSVPDDIVLKLQKFSEWSGGQELLRELLKELLEDWAVSACMSRIRKLAEALIKDRRVDLLKLRRSLPY